MSQQPEFKQPEKRNSNPSPADASHAILNVELKPKPEPEPNLNRSERLDKQEIQRIKSENSVRKLPRKASIGGSTFYISYSYLIYSGKYSIHHVFRAPNKELYSLKVDDRNPAMVLHDEKVRSKLVSVDLPKIMLSERKSSVTLTVMEPLSMTFRNLIRGFSMKRENRTSNSAILLRTGRMCIRLLKKIHDNGILHGNINPNTFILPCNPNGPDARPDLKRGPLIVDFSRSIDTKEDPAYKEETPEARFNPAIYFEDGGIYTKRDDMENLGYLLLFLANGRISWEVRKRRDLLMFGKKCLSELDRHLRGIPLVIKNYLTYVRTIKRNTTPDYALLDLCLTSKNLDIRSEIKTRKEKLRLKRKREPSVRSCSQSINICEGLLKARTEQTGNTSKRKRQRQIHENLAFQDNSLAAEREPEYFVMSLQLFPDIAIKFSVPDENVAGMHNNRTMCHSLGLNPFSGKESKEDLQHYMRDESSATPAENHREKTFGEAPVSITGNDAVVVGIKDGVGGLKGDTAANHQDIQFSGKMRSMYANSSHHDDYEQTHSTRTRTPDNIQFHFTSENEDELRHPWEDELGL